MAEAQTEYVPVTLMATESLVPHEANRRIYGDDIDTDLLESIREVGVLTPLTTTPEGVIVNGHQRWTAARTLGLQMLPVVVREYSDELAVLEALIHHNKQRVKTPLQLANEYETILAIEKERAKQRMLAGTMVDPVENSPQGQVGKAREKAAAHIGVSSNTAERLRKIKQAADDRRQAGDVEGAAALLSALNTQSVNAAWRLLHPEVQARMEQVLVASPVRVSSDPDPLDIRLPADPELAAEAIRRAYDGAWVVLLVEYLVGKTEEPQEPVKLGPADISVLHTIGEDPVTVELLAGALNRSEKSVASSLSVLVRVGKVTKVGTEGRAARYAVA